uniref:FMN-dependent NADH-azoreductase n=1 Tax=Thaumasiovibrio occultus TaxID=1891184 RepID=UPI000B34ED07|nr:FMN-dependent NADH-azoreductase [Thaumasiovibrio occultus]
MKNVLVVKSSILGNYSASTTLINEWIESQKNSYNITERDTSNPAIPVLDANVMGALGANEDLTTEQAAIRELSDNLITEIQQADTLLIAAPMYNFTVPTQLKNWIDLIARAGVTFKYTEQGPVGLIEGKKAVVLTTRGGMHKDQPSDIITGYLRTVLGFVGITDVEFVYAEGLAMGEDIANAQLNQARTALSLV